MTEFFNILPIEKKKEGLHVAVCNLEYQLIVPYVTFVISEENADSGETSWISNHWFSVSAIEAGCRIASS
jgi:hypothetical protein